MMASLQRWRRPSGLGWPKWRGWRVVMDNLLIPSGALLPRWYGVAWREPDMDGVVVKVSGGVLWEPFLRENEKA